MAGFRRPKSDDRTQCSICKEMKSFDEFYARKGGGVWSRCKICEKQAKKNDSRKKPEKASKKIRDRIYKKFGITQEKYEEMLASQNRVCAICGKNPEIEGRNHLYVDHDHSTGAVRGLLCHYCNMALGKFKDSIPLLREAHAYLKTHEA